MQRKLNPDCSSTVTCPSCKTTKPRLCIPNCYSTSDFTQAWKCFLKKSFDNCIYIFHYPELLLLHCPKFHHVQFSKPCFFCSHLFAHQLLQIEMEKKHYRMTLEHSKKPTYFQIAKGDKNQLFKRWISSAEIAIQNKTNDSSRSIPKLNQFSSYFQLDSNQVLCTITNRRSEKRKLLENLVDSQLVTFH